MNTVARLESLEARRLLSSVPAIHFNTDHDVTLPDLTGSSGGVTTAIADFNGDGRADLLMLVNPGTGQYDAFVSVRLAGRRGRLGPQRTVAGRIGISITRSSGLAVGDFNGDGHLDFAVGNIDAAVRRRPGSRRADTRTTIDVYLGDGNGAFRGAARIAALFGGGMGLVAGDFNADGHPDLAWDESDFPTATIDGYVYDSRSAIAFGRGDGTFADPVNGSTSNPTPSALTTDYNADGRADFIITNLRTNPLDVATSNTQGTLDDAGPISAVPSNLGWISAASTDVNGDGVPDLVAVERTGAATFQLQVLLGRRRGGYAKSLVTPIDPSIFLSDPRLVTGDFNADGHPDVALVSDHFDQATSTSAFVVVTLAGVGDGTFTDATTQPATGGQPFNTAVGDFNGDGKDDLMISDGLGEHFLFAS
jgi:hypothetical protein